MCNNYISQYESHISHFHSEIFKLCLFPKRKYFFPIEHIYNTVGVVVDWLLTCSEVTAS